MVATKIEPHPSRFLALGDSYTIGEGVAADECWPAQLARRLRARGIALDDPEIVARTGWTTDELSVAMDATILAPPYALVTLLVGVNNEYRGRDVDNYTVELARLLQRAIAIAGARAQRVILVSIPDWGVTRFAREHGRDPARIAAEIDVFNTAARALAASAGAGFADITAISRAAANRVDMLVADGLHPSTTQYTLWTDAIIDVAARVLTGYPSLPND
jgi:lysophospholipase L1-like esterase